MSKQWLLNAASVGGLGLLVSGLAFFQFYALGGYGDLDTLVAVGAAMTGLGGLIFMAARSGASRR